MLVRVWEKIDNIIDWKLVYRPCLDKWVTDSGLVAIMGDAAHPFLPTSTQGGSQAVEDGATIALCLAKAGKGNVPLALHTYFALRYEHVRAAQMVGITQRDKWHNLHDKETKNMTKELDTSKGVLDSYHLWLNDAEQVVHDQWDEVSAKVREKLQTSPETGAVDEGIRNVSGQVDGLNSKAKDVHVQVKGVDGTMTV
jgi:salicylate hydroxylase